MENKIFDNPMYIKFQNALLNNIRKKCGHFLFHVRDFREDNCRHPKILGKCSLNCPILKGLFENGIEIEK